MKEIKNGNAIIICIIEIVIGILLLVNPVRFAAGIIIVIGIALIIDGILMEFSNISGYSNYAYVHNDCGLFT